jgi:hypothetical protein
MMHFQCAVKRSVLILITGFVMCLVTSDNASAILRPRVPHRSYPPRGENTTVPDQSRMLHGSLGVRSG